MSRACVRLHVGRSCCDLAALIEALDLDKPALMGHSMGAATVSTMAYQRPNLTRRIVLEDPPWRIQTPEEVSRAQPVWPHGGDNLAADQTLTRGDHRQWQAGTAHMGR
ncbi:MAG: alpha/beta fold hydrolase [Caldilineaceae bacterium]